MKHRKPWSSCACGLSIVLLRKINFSEKSKLVAKKVSDLHTAKCAVVRIWEVVVHAVFYSIISHVEFTVKYLELF